MARTRAQVRAESRSYQLPALHSEERQVQSGKVRKRRCRSSQRKFEPRQANQSHSGSRFRTATYTAQNISPQQLETQLHPISPGRKRQRQAQDTLERADKPVLKRARLSDGGEKSRQELDSRDTNPIAHWAREGRWPSHFIAQAPNMNRILARKKSSSSLQSRKRSEPGSASSATPSDQKLREAKSAPYRDPRYKKLLEVRGSFMDESALGVADGSGDMILELLSSKQTIPKDSLFRDDIFKKTCRSVADRNELRVMRDISPLLVPSAELLAIFGASELECLIESINEGWYNSIPLTATRPQPDYTVGFRREAFTKGQLERLSPFIGDWIAGDQSFFMATYLIYFPFLTCEVKCGAAALDVADRQNTHSMTLAVRAVVELFRAIGREDEINRQLLAFSVSHDHQSVRIYGHYPEIQGKETTYHRRTIRLFDFTELEGKDKWVTYSFTKNVYQVWMPKHFKRICLAIDQLPSHLDFDVPSLQESGLSQDLESHNLSQSEVDLAIEPKTSYRQATPDSSFTGPAAVKKPRRKHGKG
ncbi:hypothetical protein J3459_013922 [Metarhizium acridum]|uniref:uncharacterized protein n=1 Tax=Metarhizium acridum TaxID=92637 RepID=UPI001C6B7FBD|nr:hypothetical protein J3458_013208 [Metarhizium acridum]KAG8415966.1 hypothetical protein J3459_013922 [Metarhizium acridum]